MEGQKPPPQKQGRADENKDDGPSGQPRAVSEAREEFEEDVAGISKKNYVTELLNANIWSMILDYLTDPNDVISLMEAAPVLRSDSLLEKRRTTAQLSRMLPILFEKCHLAPSEILKLRLLNKQAKVKVDKLLVQNTPSWLRKAATQIREVKQVQDILNLPEGFTGSPFIARYCFITADDVPNKLEVVRQYGPELDHAELEVWTNEVDDTMQEVQDFLPHVTNVKELTVTFVANRVLDIEDWNEYSVPGQFPAFNSLTTLHLTRYSMRDTKIMAPTASYVRPILLTYGNQLTTLSCDAFVFGGDSAGGSLRFDNLRKLEVNFFNKEELVRLPEILGNLAKISCPQLASLTLIGDMMRITAKMFLALNNFAKTLKELHLGNLKGNSRVFHAVDPADLSEFPQLTRLTLRTVDAATGWRHLFRNMFTKLEEIRFEHLRPGILNGKVRRSYFTLFPNLKRLVCILEGHLVSNDDDKEIIFLRKNVEKALGNSF